MPVSLIKQAENQANYTKLIVDEELVNALINNPSFKTSTHYVANALGISDEDTQQELYLESLHRLKTQPDQQALTELVTNRDNKIEWLITYSRHELIRKHTKSNKFKNEYESELTPEMHDTLPAYYASDNDTQVNLALTISMNTLSKARFEFAKMVLELGASETKARLNLTHTQFMERVQKLEKYGNLHRSEFDRAISSKEVGKLREEIERLRTITLFLNQEEPEGILTAYLTKYKKFFDEYIGLIGTPYITQPVLLVRDFKSAPLKDQYNFVNHVYKDIERLRTRHDKLLKEINEVIKVA